MSKYKAVLFDFDGTLSKSGEGVKKCIILTLKDMKKPCPDLSDYSQYIGPPLTHTFEKLCGLTHDEAMRALSIYREHYNKVGICENSLFDGVLDVLKTLKNTDMKLVVCTSKNQELAEKSLQAIGIYDYFDAVCGSLKDGSRKNKAELIPCAVNLAGVSDSKDVVMIGDTYFDAQGAVNSKVDFIGVLYGYGTYESMLRSGAKNFAKTPGDILKYLL